MNTSATFISYVSTITDEQLRTILEGIDTVEDVQVDVNLISITSRQTGYGTWRVVGTFEIDGERMELGATTHDEDLILASKGNDYRDLGYTQEWADLAIVDMIVNSRANVDYFTAEPKTSA